MPTGKTPDKRQPPYLNLLCLVAYPDHLRKQEIHHPLVILWKNKHLKFSLLDNNTSYYVGFSDVGDACRLTPSITASHFRHAQAGHVYGFHFQLQMNVTIRPQNHLLM